MLIDIDKIIVRDRIRKDFGDLQELADDINANGLINPPTINKDYVLLAGERRLRACKMLGWRQIPVYMIDTTGEEHDLAIEMSENNMRRNFTGSELAEGIRRQMEFESAKANERMAEGGRGGNVSTPSGKARDKAAEQFGISGRQAEKVLYVDDHKDLLDPADFADWDEGRLSTNKAYQRVKAAQQQVERERDEAREEVDQLGTEIGELQREIAALEGQVDSAYEDGYKAAQAHQGTHERVITREVVPEETRRRIESLTHERDLYASDMQKLRSQIEAKNKELERARNLLGMSQQVQDVRRDVQYLITATNQYVRQYGGLTWTVQQLSEVDAPTLEELRKAVTNLATFSSALVASLEEM